jgi:hypothetical protein
MNAGCSRFGQGRHRDERLRIGRGNGLVVRPVDKRSVHGERFAVIAKAKPHGRQLALDGGKILDDPRVGVLAGHPTVAVDDEGRLLGATISTGRERALGSIRQVLGQWCRHQLARRNRFFRFGLDDARRQHRQY